MENKVDRVMTHIRGHYSSEEIVTLVSTVLGWGSAIELSFYDDRAIGELLIEIVMSHESDIDTIMSKGIDEMPLYINHGSEISRLVVKWRMSCGH